MKENRLGKRLKMYRNALNMTQSDLSIPLNMSRQTVSTYETGARIPDIYTLWAMADIFEVSMDDLIGRNSNTQNMHQFITKTK